MTNQLLASLAAALAAAWSLGAGPARAWDEGPGPPRGRFCTYTALAQAKACRFEARDDHQVARAVCLNVADADERAACFAEALAERREGWNLCREQRMARKELCNALGEAPYEPDFDPALFDEDFADLTRPNPYFPLATGNRWRFEGAGETVDIVVLAETKAIEGVTCIVVNDRVEKDGVVVEDTDDWFGQRRDGTVEYCGESVRDFEVFAGDDPADPELVSIDGSFKAGRDGAKSGTQFPGDPAVGQVYRQEWSPGNAEDAARILSTTFGPDDESELGEHTPDALVELFCAANDCVVISEFSPIEPGIDKRKYYAPGVGLIAEVDPESGEVVQLVDCSFDVRCAALPSP